MLLGEAGIHAEDFGGKERGLIAAGAGANFQNHVLLVVGVLGQKHDLDLFFQDGLARGQRGDLFLGHRAQPGVALGQHRARLRQPLAHLLQLAVLHHRGFKVAERLAGLLILFAVVDHLGQRELGAELLVALFHLFQTINHMPSGPRGFGVVNCVGK